METSPISQMPAIDKRGANGTNPVKQVDAAARVESNAVLNQHAGEVQVLEVIGHSGVQGQGPFMNITLVCLRGRVVRAHFETYGCPSAIRCGDWIVKWAPGREVATLRVLEPEDLALVVGGLPLGKEFCAEMAVSALQEAVQQVLSGMETGSGAEAKEKVP